MIPVDHTRPPSCNSHHKFISHPVKAPLSLALRALPGMPGSESDKTVAIDQANFTPRPRSMSSTSLLESTSAPSRTRRRRGLQFALELPVVRVYVLCLRDSSLKPSKYRRRARSVGLQVGKVLQLRLFADASKLSLSCLRS